MNLAQLPDSFVEVERWTIEATEDLARLRAALHRALTGADLPPRRGIGEVPEKAVLVASELATNALRHGRPPTLVRLLSDGRRFAVDVVDQAPHAEPRIAGDRAPGEGGFGLILAQRVSQGVGWYREGDRAKHVWALFEASPAAGTEMTGLSHAAQRASNPEA
ncbi:ATP-binding protein [Cellulomonas endophytica]|uniref:ATP-binding protein n=1 Tax=Cellulomonas endophytica TaxID=2494735 RepID=UPI00196AE381|nr:ATP-binding protein [Cellulomonas endophytica]